MNPPRAMATLIGSLPHKSTDDVLNKIFSAVPEAPIWPQLPMRDWREGFLPQYSEAMPARVEHPEEGKVSVNTESPDLAEELTSFYEKSILATESGDFSEFAISRKASEGFYKTLDYLKTLDTKPEYAKVHTTGAVSFSLTVFDQKQVPLYFDDTFADVCVQLAALCSRWQIQQYKPYAENIICFLDEPTLSAFGSSCYINVTREEVIKRLSATVDAVHEEGALAGVHVCGNSEWTILMDAGVDIINFDAYGYGESMALYADRVDQFLQEGKSLAWGVIPTSPKIFEESAENLDKRLTEVVKNLAGQGVDENLIWQQSIITPSCGMGTMSIEGSELVMQRLREVSEIVQKRIR